MPVSGRLRGQRRGDAGAAQEARRARRRRVGAVAALAAPRSTARAETLFLDDRRRRRDARRRPAAGARPGDRQAADPEGHAVPARRRLDQRELRAPRARAGRAARRRGRAGARARPRCRPHDARPSLRGAGQRRSRCDRRRAYADAAARRRRRDRRASPSAAPRSLRQLQAGAAAAGLAPIDDDALLDEVTGLVERPNVLVCTLRARVPRGAAGMPDPDDEGEPEVLPAARRRRAG